MASPKDTPTVTSSITLTLTLLEMHRDWIVDEVTPLEMDNNVVDEMDDDEMMTITDNNDR